MLHTSISICFHREKYIPLKFVIYGCAIVRLNNKQFLYEMNEFVENLNKNHYWRWFVWIVVFCTKWACSNVRFLVLINCTSSTRQQRQQQQHNICFINWNAQLWMSYNQSADCIITTNLFDFKYIWSVGFCFVHCKFTALAIWHIDRLPNFIAKT